MQTENILNDSRLRALENHTRVNLLRPTRGTSTSNGVTCTNNGDGTYTLNGTASAQTDFGLSTFILKAGKYKLTGNPNEVSTSAFWIGILDTVNGWQIGELCFNKDGSLVNNTTEQQAILMVRIYGGTVLNNLVFKPMLTTDLTAAYDDFVSYEDSFAINQNAAQKQDVLTLEEIQASTDLSGKIASASALKDLKEIIGDIEDKTYQIASGSSMDIPINDRCCYLVIGIHGYAGAWCRLIKTITGDKVSIATWNGANLGESYFTVTSVDKNTINVAIGDVGGRIKVHLIRLGYGT